MFWHRELWKKAGGKIDESFRFAMDSDLILRFRQAGAVFKRVPRFLGVFRVYQAQKKSRLECRWRRGNEYLRERCHGYVPSYEDIGANIKVYILCSWLHYQLLAFNKFLQFK